jgi:hypothetical protein
MRAALLPALAIAVVNVLMSPYHGDRMLFAGYHGDNRLLFHQAWGALQVTVTAFGLQKGILLGLRWLSLVAPAAVFIYTTRPEDFAADAFSGLVEGIVGSFILPIGVFGLVVLPAQGLILDAVFGWRRAKPTRLLPAIVAGALAGMFFVFIIVYVFFEVRKPFPLVASLLGGVAGSVSGSLGCLLARHITRLGIMPDSAIGREAA